MENSGISATNSNGNGSANGSTSSFFPAPSAAVGTGTPSVTTTGSSGSTGAASQYGHSRMMSGSSSSSSSLFEIPSIALDPVINSTGSSPSSNVKSRSRAGTLPSRLSPGLIGINRFGGGPPATHPPGASTPGSLSSIGVNKSFSPFDSPNLVPIGGNATEYHQQLSNRASRQSLQPYSDPAHRLSMDLDNFQLARSKSNSSNIETSGGSRLRSGSLNIPSETRPSFSPFGPSIWANPSGGSEGQTQTQSQQPQRAKNQQQQQSQPSLHASPSNITDDPMKPFLNELSARTDISRLRSYTVNTLPYSLTDEEAELLYAQQQYQNQNQAQTHPLQTVSPQQLYPLSLAGSRQRAATVSSPALDSQYRYANQRKATTTANVGSTGQGQGQSPPLLADQGPSADSTEEPTRSLWIGKLPSNYPVHRLQALFANHGPVESVRILSNKNCGFVNFSATEYAIKARADLNGKELFPNMGPCRVGFAKVVDSSPLNHGEEAPVCASHYTNSGANGMELPPPAVPPTLEQVDSDLLNISRQLEATLEEVEANVKMINRAKSRTYSTEIGPIPELRPDRVYDAPMLREIRKKIDTGVFSTEDTENFALNFLDDVAAFSSDYVGNTVVQKLFEICSEPVKDMMLKRIAPHLAAIGVHKNGTWAAQKIIDVCRTSRQTKMISDALRPYTRHLFLDQFGNYVIQCCLKFGSPWNDFIFEAMLVDFIPISQGRFGVRAMRACLESQFANVARKRLLAATIIVYVVPLTMNTNGALLITWLLDTCTFNHRHQALAPRLTSQLVVLATHKLASLTLLKVIHNGGEESSHTILYALFGDNAESTGTLEAILKDPHHGPTFIYKILSTTSLLEGANRQRAISKIRAILSTVNVNANIGVYRRLLEEVGLLEPQILSNGNNGSQRYDASVPPGASGNNRRQPRQQSQQQTLQNGHQGQQGQHGQQQKYQVHPASRSYYGPVRSAYDDTTLGLEQLSLGNAGSQRMTQHMMYSPQQYAQAGYSGDYYIDAADVHANAAMYPSYGAPPTQNYISPPAQSYNMQATDHLQYYDRQQ